MPSPCPPPRRRCCSTLLNALFHPAECSCFVGMKTSHCKIIIAATLCCPPRHHHHIIIMPCHVMSCHVMSTQASSPQPWASPMSDPCQHRHPPSPRLTPGMPELAPCPPMACHPSLKCAHLCSLSTSYETTSARSLCCGAMSCTHNEPHTRYDEWPYTQHPACYASQDHTMRTTHHSPHDAHRTHMIHHCDATDICTCLIPMSDKHHDGDVRRVHVA